MRCKNCGKEISACNTTCEFCGMAIDDSRNNQPSIYQNSNTNHTNTVNSTDKSALIGLIFIIAGVVMAIITIMYLAEIDNSKITRRYNSTTSSMAIMFFLHIIIQSVLSVFLGLRIAANGLAAHKVQAIGNAITLVGGALFLMSSVGLGIVLQVIGLIIFVMGCRAN